MALRVDILRNCFSLGASPTCKALRLAIAGFYEPSDFITPKSARRSTFCNRFDCVMSQEHQLSRHFFADFLLRFVLFPLALEPGRCADPPSLASPSSSGAPPMLSASNHSRLVSSRSAQVAARVR